MPGPSFQNDRKLSVMTEPGPPRSEEDLPPRRGGSLDWPARPSDWTSIPEHQEDNEETRLLAHEDEEDGDNEAPHTATATVPPAPPAFPAHTRPTFGDQQWNWDGAGKSPTGWSQSGPPPAMPIPMPFERPQDKPEPMRPPLVDLDAWRAVYDDLRVRDESMIKDYREEIDTLLVFAGLFSAIVTAFVIESYTALQEDYTQTSADLLRTISLQLANSSAPAAAPKDITFSAATPDVQVNTCWFLSLILSLVTALLGILLKQWIRTYIKWVEVTPESDAVALRHYRHTHFQSWHMPLMLTMLPVLLQVALVLFLTGLAIFLSQVNNTVATVTSIAVALCLLLGLIVTFLPLVQKACPYKSPLTEFLISVLGYTLHTLEHWRSNEKAGRRRRGASSYRGRIEDLRTESWSDIDLKAMRTAEAGAKLYPSRTLAHVGSLMTTLASTRSLHLWEKTISCLVDHYDNHTYNGTIGACWAVVTHIFGAAPLERGDASKSHINLLPRFSVQGRVNLFHLCESSISSLNGQREPDDRAFLKLLFFTIRALKYIEPGHVHSGRFMPVVLSVSRWAYLMTPEELTCAVDSIHFALGTILNKIGWKEDGEDADKICSITKAFAFTCHRVINDEQMHFLDLLLQLALDSVFSQTSGGLTDELRKLLEFVGKGEYAKPRSLPRVRFIAITFPLVLDLIRNAPELLPQPWIQTLWVAHHRETENDIEEIPLEILLEHVLDREEFDLEELWQRTNDLRTSTPGHAINPWEMDRRRKGSPSSSRRLGSRSSLNI